MTEFGPTGQVVYERTYARVKPDGTRETWPETVERVVDGNLALKPEHVRDGEREQLIDMMTDFKIVPAGRHLWASGVKGRQYLFNCHVSGWDDFIAEHFVFTFMRLMEGGGVGANYSNSFLEEYREYSNWFEIHIVCDSDHPDYSEMKDAGLLSDVYVSDWDGAYEVPDSREGWAETLRDLINTYYRSDVQHNRRVYDVSRVRGKGTRLKTFGGSASGPLPLARMLHKVADVMNCTDPRKLSGLDAMEIDHAIAECVVSGGNRRSARMAIMHWKDHEIAEFISCKSETGSHWTTNISVELDDEFFEALSGDNSDLYHWADTVLEIIAEGMVQNGEPGIWNSTLSNVGEPTPVEATNPCGEIPLQAWENCNLGHVNFAAFIEENGELDAAGMSLAHQLMTRFLMRATYGDVNDPKQAEVLAQNRRIGVGHFGVASAIAMGGVKYSEVSDTDEPIFGEQILKNLAEIVHMTATQYAHELRIPVPVKTRTVAPTGTIAKMPGVSEGIHPIYAKYFLRRIRFSDNDPAQVETVESYRAAGFTVEPCKYAPATSVVTIPTEDNLVAAVRRIQGEKGAQEYVESADDLTLDHMLSFQAMYQKYWADNAVSYTANIDETFSIDDVKDAIRFYGPILKGMTVFPEFGMEQSPYERITEEEYLAYSTRTRADGIDENCVNGCPVK